jgi:transcriptional regulator with XRE-family HTH domain
MIGKMLKKMRTDKGLNQVELASLLSVNQTTLSGWERGYREPTFSSIEKIAELCDFKIYFENNRTNEKVEIKDLNRKDI